MVSSLLLLFIPQKCDGRLCTLTENLNESDPSYKTGFLLNYLTTAAFVLMYITEIRREEKLIKLLEVNHSISTDNDSVGTRLHILPEYKQQQICQVVQQHQYASYFVIVAFIVNTIYSWQLIYPRNLGNQTLLNFVTNILFMISKLTNVLGIIHTDEHIFLSSYLNTKVQFNDIDPREIEKIRRLSSKTEYQRMELEEFNQDRKEEKENLSIEENVKENLPIEEIENIAI